MTTTFRSSTLRSRLFLEALEDRRTPTTFTVNSLLDDGSGSGNSGTLRYCIVQANTQAGDDTIDFSVAGSITLGGAQLTLTDTTGKTTITGPGANLLTIDGKLQSRVFGINTNVTAEIGGVTVTKGKSNTGGGISNNGMLTVTNSTISGNSADGGSGGGISNNGIVTIANSTISNNSSTNSAFLGGGGGIINFGTMSVTNSTISYNSTTNKNTFNGGGGITNSGMLMVTTSTISYNFATNSDMFSTFGGGIVNTGTLTVTNSTLAGNSTAGRGGGINNGGTVTVTNSTLNGNSAGISGGGIVNSGKLTVANSTISGNSASFNGGGIYVLGGDFTSVTVMSSTLSGNSASAGGGIFNTNNFDTGISVVSVTTSTITGNSANVGGGVFNVDFQYYANTVNLTNTIVSGNAAASASEIYNNGTINANANCLFGASAVTNAQAFVGFTPGANDLTATIDGTIPTALSAILGPLGNYGGPTQTVPLLPGSPALNAGISGLGIPANDQRGLGRVGAPDIGAFESQGFQFLASGSGQSTNINTKFANPLVVNVFAKNELEPINGGVVAFTPPGAGASAALSAMNVTIVGGKASVTATANGTPGSYNLTAKSGALSANFALTNVNPIVVGPPNVALLQFIGGNLTVTFTNAANNIALSGQTGLVTVRSNNTVVGSFAVTGAITINAGVGNDTVAIAPNAGQSLPGNVTVNTGVGNDLVQLKGGGTVNNFTVNLGEGNNSLTDTGAKINGNWTITAGGGGDTVGPLTSPVAGILNMNLGNGSNTATVQSKVGGQLRYTGGAGNDNLTLGGANSYYLYTLMGAGDDTVAFVSGSSIGGGLIDFGAGLDQYVPNGVFVGSGLTLLNL